MNRPQPATCPRPLAEPGHGDLSDDERARFVSDGYLVLRQRIAPAAIASVRDAVAAEVDAIIARLHAAGAIAGTGDGLPFHQRLCVAREHLAAHGRSWTANLAGQALYDLHHEPGLLGAITALIGPDPCGHRQFNARPKLPEQAMTVVPWHQDSGYYGPGNGRDLIVTAWIPLVPVDAANGCMQVVPGSQALGEVAHVPADDAGGFLLADTPIDPAAVRTLAMEPGDVLLLDNLTLHRSLPNRSDGIRWSVDLRFFAAEAQGAADLRWGFPRPWRLRGGDAPDCGEWAGWYRAA